MHRYIVILVFSILLLSAATANAGNISATLDVTPQSSATNEYTIHTITWSTVMPIDIFGHIVIYYDSDFNLGQLSIADTYDPATMDGRLNIDSTRTAAPNWKKIYISRKDGAINGDGDIGVKLALVGNPTPGDYTVRVETFAAGVNPAVATPEDSGSATIRINERITTFQLTTSVTNPKAGVPFELFVTNARDAENNLADGIVNVSFEFGSLQDHKAPDGTLPDLVPIAVQNGSGSALQTLYLDEPGYIRLKGQVSGGTFYRYTNQLSVGTGDIGSFDLTGYPDSTIAGTDFTGSVTVKVKAYDKWRNPKVDYAGLIYFDSSNDPNAEFTYDRQNPYPFSGTQDGEAEFNGQDFEFRTAGERTFFVSNYEQTVIEESDAIRVIPGAIQKFSFEPIQNQKAGEAFEVKVINAFDHLDNPTSGTITVSLFGGGDHKAPNGQQPLLNNIKVFNGTGSAFQSLVKAENLQINGQASPGVTSLSNQFTVMPTLLASFGITGYPQQIQANEFFPQGVTVTAFDTYKNLKTDFGQEVTFTSTDPAATLPPPYKFNSEAQHIFPGTRFKLVTLGPQSITVSNNGISGTTDPIQVLGPNNIQIQSIVTNMTQVSRGQLQVPVTMNVANSGSIPFENYSASLNFRLGQQDLNSDYFVQSSSSTGTIPAGGQKTITFYVDVSQSATLGDITIDGSITGYFENDYTEATNANLTDSWLVLRPANLQIVSADVVPDTIPKGSFSNEIHIRLANNGGLTNSADAAVDNISISFTDALFANVTQQFPITASPSNPTTIAGGDTSLFVYYIESRDTAPTGSIVMSMQATYRDVNLQVQKILTGNSVDSFESITAAKLLITSIISEDSTVTQGQQKSFLVEMQVRNEGGSALDISFDEAKTYIKFRKGGTEYISPNDVESPSTLKSGATSIPANASDILQFRVVQVQSSVPDGDLTIFGRVESVNGIYSTSEISQVYGQLLVQKPDNVRILKIIPSQSTLTVDDDTYPWQVRVAVQNSGGSDVMLSYANTTLSFSKSNFIVNPPSTANGDARLVGGETDTLIFGITQTGGPRGSTTIDATVEFEVINTEEIKTVRASDAGKQATILLQDPAELSIRRIHSSVHQISVNQMPPDWTVAVEIENSGEASLDIDIANIDSTWLRFYIGGTPFSTFQIEKPQSLAGSRSSQLPGGARDSLIYRILSNNAAVGLYELNASVKGVETNRQKRVVYSSLTTATNTDTVRVTERASLAYIAGTLAPPIVNPGRPEVFQLVVRNSGGADLVLDPEATTFTLDAGIETLIARCDAASGTVIPANDSLRLFFRETYITSSFPRNAYIPVVRLNGTENGLPFSTILNMNGETVTVADAGGITLAYQQQSVSTVTQGQTNPWTVEIGISNYMTQTLRLDEARLVFSSGTNDVSDKFTVQGGDILTNGSQLLPSGQSSSVLFTITEVSQLAPEGEVLIGAVVFMTDNQGAGEEYEETIYNKGKVTIQTMAFLQIQTFQPSQFSVTSGQTEAWIIGSRIKNLGSSAVKIDVNRMRLDLVDYGNDLFVTSPPFLFVQSQSDTLLGGAEDSLFFQINKVDESLPVTRPGVQDSIKVIADIATEELNTGRPMIIQSKRLGIAIQDSARIRIDKLVAMIESGDKVNAGDEFYLQALVKHTGDPVTADIVKKATLQVKTVSPGYFIEVDTMSVFDLAPGDSAWLSPIKVITPADPNQQGQFTIDFTETRARNTNNRAAEEKSAPEYTTVSVVTQNPAFFQIDSVVTSKRTISAGSTLPWTISVAVRNLGDGVVELNDPQISDVDIYNQAGELLEPASYRLEPQPIGGNKRLSKDQSKILTYIMQNTWRDAGLFTIKATVRAKELNDITVPLIQTDSTTVEVSNAAAVRIRRTNIDTVDTNVDAQGVAHVNTNQEFVVSSLIRNESSGNYIKKIKLVLDTFKSQVADPDTQEIDILEGNEDDTVYFIVKADSMENLVGEELRARIVLARTGDDADAQVLPALDSLALVKIYRPAQLRIVATENLAPNPAQHVSLGQNFAIRVKVKNEGSETAQNVALSLTPSENLVIVQDSLQTLSDELKGGEIDSVDFYITAGTQEGQVNFTARIEETARGVNSRQLPAILTADDDTTFARLEPGANLVIDDVLPSQRYIKANDKNNPWLVKVAVSNTGRAHLEFAGIADTNITFSRGGEKDVFYQLTAPTGLENAGDFVLRADSTDTLVYRVWRNGEFAGLVDIRVLLNAVDLNTKDTGSELILTASAEDSVDVTADVAVVISKTGAATNKQDQNGYALTNRGSPFDVTVDISTGQFGGVDSVIVRLTSDGNSITDALEDTIATIAADATEKARFSIIADDTWDPNTGEKSEQFFAEIVRAYVKNDTSIVAPRTPVAGANVAKVRIQTPAKLSYHLQLGTEGGALVKVGQEFNVIARMENLGRAPIGSGKLTITPPLGYSVKSTQNIFVQAPVEKSFSWRIDQDTLDVAFTMLAPDTASGPDVIRTEITEKPLDLNSEEVVDLGEIDSLITVNTVESVLAIRSFQIIDPPGAMDGTLSTEQIFTLQAVVQSSQNLVDRQAVLTLPTLSIQPGYELRSPQVVEIKVERDTIRWTIQAPIEAVADPHEFELHVTGGEFGVNFAEDSRTIEMTRVEKKVSLSLQPLEIEPGGVLRNETEAFFTRNQQAVIKTRIENDGQAEYEGSGTVEIEFRDSGLSLTSGNAQQVFFDNSEISWQVQAPNTAIDGELIRIRITAENIRDVNTNKSVSLTKSEHNLIVFVNEGGTISAPALRFEATTGEQIDSVSSAQPFIVKANIETNGVKDNNIRATLYSKNGGFAILDPERIIPSSGSYERPWTVIAPADFVNTSDSLYVVVEAEDLQSESPLSRRSQGLYVPVVERTTFAFEPYISDPIALKGSDRLSTEQTFSITAEINHSGAAFETDGRFVVQLSVPVGFQLIEGDTTEKIISAEDFVTSGTNPVWTLIAPANKSESLSNFQILVHELPIDVHSKQEAIALKDNINFPIRVIEKAKVYFDAYLHGDVLSDSASVRSGNDFEITAWLNNVGEAGLTGTYSVKLTLPPQFTFVSGDSVQDAISDSTNQITWLIESPRIATTEPDTFQLEILQLPNDQFAYQPVTLQSDSTAFVQVTLETGALIIKDYKVRATTGVIRGQFDVPIIGLNIKNKDASGSTKSFLNGIHMSIRDKMGHLISPNPMISRIAAVRDDAKEHIFAETTTFNDSGQVYLDFKALHPDTLVGNVTDNIKIVVDVLENAELKDFRVTIDSSSFFTAIDEFDIPLKIADSTGTQKDYLGMASMMVVLADASLEKSFFNYPNPFGRADDPLTSFVYYLKEDSDFKIHIYTLTGELVKTWEFTQAEHPDLTSAGLHQGHAELNWDGNNGMNQPVMNGVYLAYISTNSGEKAFTKIAVVR
ncbi:hypothetical protein JXA70_06115 [candidate division KSB1 bacterium]|nr:hypothetical protein [candidate division KSB1 bacterium]